MTARAWMVGAGVLSAALVLGPMPVQAQGSFGIGPRITFVRGSDDSEGSQRFSGGSIRLGGGKTALELAMDYRSGLTGDLTERIKDYPIQVSLLMFPVKSTFSPYLLAGIGWYSQNVQQLEPGVTTPIEDETMRRRGYHAGFGGELRVHRRVGLHGDYRYTFLRFGDDDEIETTGASGTPRLIPFAERLKLSHQGSMFTWGATVYF